MLVDLGKIIKYFKTLTFFTVKDVYGRNVDVISREDLLNEFMAMAISPEFEEIKTCKSDKNMQELTWEDVKKIVVIADQIIQTSHDRIKWEDKSEEDYYKEVLSRFKENN